MYTVIDTSTRRPLTLGNLKPLGLKSLDHFPLIYMSAQHAQQDLAAAIQRDGYGEGWFEVMPVAEARGTK